MPFQLLCFLVFYPVSLLEVCLWQVHWSILNVVILCFTSLQAEHIWTLPLLLWQNMKTKGKEKPYPLACRVNLCSLLQVMLTTGPCFSIKLKLITTFEEKYRIWTFFWKQIVFFLHYDLSGETWLVFALLFWNSAAITFHPILNSLCLTCLLNHYYYTFSLNKCCSRNPAKNLQGILLFLVRIRIIQKDCNKDCEGEISFYSVSTFCLVSWVTRGIWQEAAGVELQLLHEMDLPIVTETVDVPLTQDEDVGRSMGERGHTEIQGLLSQHKYPVRLWEHTKTQNNVIYCTKKKLKNCMRECQPDMCVVWTRLIKCCAVPFC